MAKIITVQQEQRADGVLPYPFHIVAHAKEAPDWKPGDVLRQDVWNGRPEALVGFQRYAERQQIDLDLKDFLDDPERAVGMTPAMRDSRGAIYTFPGIIQRVATADRPGKDLI